ncbi:zinc-binding alcohol dehydrogenase family protein [Alicyclobacillus sp. SP_1]|uniref:quinone oxidoreductase family protein n=1 Tax=Alicyclobacillus sp. SP_1 TaxID=2942475 RepID=UPI002157521F|nr:zinc-binding alcohol dehydrogenase family protein [Alicyclobacillus sp. SP_1]
MKAVRIVSPCNPPSVELTEVPRPESCDGDALISVHAASINPSDAKNAMGFFSETRFPRTPGRDFAGIVVDGPANWSGKEVFGMHAELGFKRDGTHAEYVVVPSACLVERPSQLPAEQAAAMGVVYSTAWYGVVQKGEVCADMSVLVTGVTGSVGRAAAEIAAAHGAQVFGTIRSEAARQRAPLPVLADMVSLDDPAWPTKIREWTGGRGVDVVFDAVGGPLFNPSLSCLRQRGKYVVIASAVTPSVSLNLIDFYHREAHLIGVDSLKLTAEETQAVLTQVSTLVCTGRLTPPTVHCCSFEEAPLMYQRLAAGEEHRKLVLVSGR